MATGNPFTTAQVSPTMQMVAPDLAAQQVQLTRQQQIAQMLREQSMTPMGDTQMVGGWAVKKSPLEGIAKLGQALAGAYMQSQGDDQQLALSRALQGRMADILGSGQGSQPSAPPMPGQLGSGMADAADPSIAPPAETGSAPVVDRGNLPLVPPQQAQATPNNFNLGNLLKGSVIESMGGNNAGSAFWDQFKSTDPTRMALAAGLNPQQANADALAKANYIAPVNARPGSILRDPRTNMPIAYNPHVPDGATPTFDASGNVVGMNPIPGALPLMQAASQATAAGKAAVTPVNGFDASGNPTFTNQLVASQGGVPGAPAGQAPADGRYPAPVAGAVRPGLTPAAQAAGTEAGKGAGELWTTDSNAANGYSTRMFTLGKALTGLQGADTGPGSDAVNGAKSFLMAQSPAWLKEHLPGVDPSKIASYDEANKYLMQYAIGQAGSMGQGTDGKLAAVLSGNANTHISNLAAQDVVKANMGLERMRQAQVQQFNNTGLPPDQYPKWTAQWNKQINPNVFIWDNLDPTKRAMAAKSMTPQQKQAFTAQYNWALQNKFIDGPQTTGQ